jgi:GNAT superfamily N-acetyltransferase
MTTWKPDALRHALQLMYPGAQVDVFEATLDGERALRLSMLVVPETRRGLGMGTQIMKAICAYADEHGAMILLSPFTERGVRYRNRLVRWYKSLGFVENKGRRKDFRFRDTMYRPPS